MTAVPVKRDATVDPAPRSLADDINAIAEAICDAEGFAVNAENVRDCLPVAKAALRKSIEIMLPVAASSTLIAHRLGELADQVEKFEPTPETAG